MTGVQTCALPISGAGFEWTGVRDRPTLAAARKALADRCRIVVARGVASALAGTSHGALAEVKPPEAPA